MAIDEPSYIDANLKIVFTYKGKDYIADRDFSYIIDTSKNLVLEEREVYSLTTTVIDVDDNIVANAEVLAGDQQCITDENGICVLSTLAKNNYSIQAYIENKYAMKKLLLEQNTSITLKVLLSPPFANAGLDQTIMVGEDAILSADLSYSPDGNNLSFEWSEDNITLSTDEIFTIATPSIGSYKYILKVTDTETSLSHTDEITITVGSIREMLAGKTVSLVYARSAFLGSGLIESAIKTRGYNQEITMETGGYEDHDIIFTNDTIMYPWTTISLILNGKYIDRYLGDNYEGRYYQSESDAIEDIAQQLATLKTLLIGKTLYYKEYDYNAGAYIVKEHTFIESEILGEIFPFDDYSKAKEFILYGNGSVDVPYYFNQADVPL